jgi:thiol-disulfide isomerase/thioredoxin
MKTKKMSLASIQGKLSRVGMEKIMAGSGGGCLDQYVYGCSFSSNPDRDLRCGSGYTCQMNASNYIYKIFSVFLFFFFSTTFLNAQSFQLNGKIENTTNDIIYIRYYSEALKRSVLDSSLITNRSFLLKGDLSMPALAIVSLQNDQSLENAALIFIEPTNMNITLDADSMSKAVLTGSYSNRVYDTLQFLQNRLRADYQGILDSVEKFGKNTASKELLEKHEEFVLKLRTLDTTFMMARPNSIVTAFFLQQYFRIMPKDRIVYYYENIGAGLQNGVYGQQVIGSIENLSKASIGDLASDFERLDFHNNKISLHQFRGKYVLLDFWAHWCVPCRQANPHLIELHKKYHAKGLEVIGISSDDYNLKEWREAIKNDVIDIWYNVLTGMDPEKAKNGIFNPGDFGNLYGV